MALEKQTSVKQRAVRIPLDYFRQKSGLERWKSGLALLAVAAGLVYIAWSTIGSSGPSHYSPGPLASVHSMWNDHCEVCHQNFTPTGAGAWSGNPHAADVLCQACHRGQEHTSKQLATEVASCAACHVEHRGRDADLIRVADTQCTVCHANLAAHMSPDAKPLNPPLADVNSFITDHPDFRSAKRDPAQLKFSHSRHMRPGLTFGLNPMTLNDLAPDDRQRYRANGQTDTDVVTLNCSSCHQLDRSSMGQASASGQSESQSNQFKVATVSATAIPVRPSGDYMLPISFEMDCQACHQLTYAGRTKPVEAAAENSARYLIAKQSETVPHGWSDEPLRRYLTQVLDMRFINNPDHDLLKSPLQPAVQEPLEKWRLPNRPPKANELPENIGEYLSDELQVAVKNLRLQCAECHQMSPQSGSLAVQKVSTRPVWFAYAKFNHVAHRAVSCQSCHSGAYPGDLPVEPSAIETLDGDNVPIPGRQLCLHCHSPPQGSGTDATGGARFDCVECHSYHHGDDPWHGAGDATGGAAHEMSVENFIDGETTNKNSKSQISNKAQ
jgi:hypothetical protein